MSLALRLAEKGRSTVSPNPMSSDVLSGNVPRARTDTTSFAPAVLTNRPAPSTEAPEGIGIVNGMDTE